LSTVTPEFPAKSHIVLGGLGFIGSRLILELLSLNQKCLIIDNESLGTRSNLKAFASHPNLTIITGDATEESIWHESLAWAKNSEILVWHFAANSDIAAGSFSLQPDLKNTLTSSTMLCKFVSKMDCKGVIFASSSAVYGELNSETGFLENQVCTPKSYYGAAKLASELFLGIALSRLNVPLWIFRFANIVGSPATHGVIFDLLRKLQIDGKNLQILGDGNQCKTYLEVSDLISCMFHLVDSSKVGIWNLGPGDEGVSVSEISKLLIDHISPNATLHFGTESRGWLGDVPLARMECSKLEQATGLTFPSSKSAVHSAIHQIATQLEITYVCHNV
jgi:UDP-glucose 4-epimerase